MPLFFQQDIDGDTKLGIWKIEEEAIFFSEKVPVSKAISHPHKRLQHLAGRYLLSFLYKDFPLALIRIADTRKPFLPDEAYHFSISHCGAYAAALVSRSKRVGLDIELNTDIIGRVAHKFITPDEAALQVPAVLIWSCKEALFKWYAEGGVDFKEHMQITSTKKVDDHNIVQAVFKKGKVQQVHLTVKFFDNLCLSYITTEV